MQELDMAETKPDLRKILLIGQEGSGKTRFLTTMPKPIYVFNFDKGYQTLAGQEGITVGLFMDDNRYTPKAYSEFKLKFDEFKKGQMKYKWKDGREEPYKTIAIDSITALSKYVLDHEQGRNNTIDKPGGFGVWGNVKSRLQDVVTQSVFLAEYAVFTAIIETEKDDLTGEIFFKPSCDGSFRNEIGQWMDAVFFMQVDKVSGGKKKYNMLTVGDRRYKAKLRVPSSMSTSIQNEEEPDFGKLMNKINSNQ
jgi:hypothetical protein